MDAQSHSRMQGAGQIPGHRSDPADACILSTQDSWPLPTGAASRDGDLRTWPPDVMDAMGGLLIAVSFSIRFISFSLVLYRCFMLCFCLYHLPCSARKVGPRIRRVSPAIATTLNHHGTRCTTMQHHTTTSNSNLTCIPETPGCKPPPRPPHLTHVPGSLPQNPGRDRHCHPVALSDTRVPSPRLRGSAGI